MSEAEPTHVRQSITLSLTEVALGSVVHAFHIPLGGYALSLNQAAILTWAVRASVQDSVPGRGIGVRAASTVSTTAAILKSFSPAGNRLAPMLAISIQGLLFSLGVALLGARLFGVLLGASLLSLWGFVQPILFAGILYGKPFFEGLLKTWNELAKLLDLKSDLIVPLLAGVVLLKMVLAALLAFMVWRSSSESEEAYLTRLETMAAELGQRKKTRPASTATPLGGALRDLANWPFLLGTVVSLGFFAGSGAHGAPEIVFYGLRIFGTGLLLFWALRAFPTRWSDSLKARFPGLAHGIEEAKRRIQR